MGIFHVSLPECIGISTGHLFFGGENPFRAFLGLDRDASEQNVWFLLKEMNHDILHYTWHRNHTFFKNEQRELSNPACLESVKGR